MRSDAPEFVPTLWRKRFPLNPHARPFYPAAAYDEPPAPPPTTVVSFRHQSAMLDLIRARTGSVTLAPSEPPNSAQRVEDEGPPELAIEDRHTSEDGRFAPSPRRVLERGDYYMEAEVEGVHYETLLSDDNGPPCRPPRRRPTRKPRPRPKTERRRSPPVVPVAPPLKEEEEAPPLSSQLSEAQPPELWRHARWRAEGPTYSEVARVTRRVAESDSPLRSLSPTEHFPRPSEHRSTDLSRTARPAEQARRPAEQARRPVEQSLPQRPVEQPLPRRPVEQPLPKRPVEQPLPRRPIEQPLPQRPVEQPLPRRPVEQPLPRRPVEQPLPVEQPSPVEQPPRRPIEQSPAPEQQEVPVMSQPALLPAKKGRFSKFAAMCLSHQLSGPTSDPFQLSRLRPIDMQPSDNRQSSEDEKSPEPPVEEPEPPVEELVPPVEEPEPPVEEPEPPVEEPVPPVEEPVPPVEEPVPEESVPPVEEPVHEESEPPVEEPVIAEIEQKVDFPRLEAATRLEDESTASKDVYLTRDDYDEDLSHTDLDKVSSSTIVAVSVEDLESELPPPKKAGLPTLNFSTTSLFSKVTKNAVLASLDEAAALASPRDENSPVAHPETPDDGLWPAPTRSAESGRVVWSIDSLLQVRGFPSCNRRPEISTLADVLLPTGGARKTVQFLSSFGTRVGGAQRHNKSGLDQMWDLRSGSVLKNSLSLMRGGKGRREDGWRMPVKAQVPIEVPGNAWVVLQKKEKDSGDELKLVARRLRGLLNKMTEERFDSLYGEMLELITRPEEAKALIALVFEKATTQHTYVKMYAHLTCKLDHDLKEKGIFSAPSQDDEDDAHTDTLSAPDFRHLILQECQETHQRNLNSKFEPSEECSEEDRFEELLKYKLRMKGNLKLTGELLVRGMMAPKVGFSIMEELLDSREEQQVEALATFMATVGYYYERSGRVRPKTMQQYHAYVARVSELAHDEELPTRLRCLLKDVLEARTLNGDEAASSRFT